MLLTEDISRVLLQEMPHGYKMEPLAADIDEELHQAEYADNLLLKEKNTPKEIYYSFLKQTLEENPTLSLRDGIGAVRLAEKKMIHSMFQESLEYETIIKAMTNSVSLAMVNFNKNVENEKQELHPQIRWTMAFLNVSRELNPMLSQASIAQAKPYHSISFTAGNDEDYYTSALREVFKRRPNLSLKDADKLVVKILHKNDHSLKHIKDIMRSSPYFSINDQELPQDDTERCQVLSTISEVLEEFIKNTIQEEIPFPRRAADAVSSMEPEQRDNNDLIIQKMKKELETLQEHQYESDGLKYWKKTLHVIESCFAELQIEKQKAVCEVLMKWSDTISTAISQMDLEHNPQIAAIHDKAVIYKQKAKLEQKEWTKLFDMIEFMDTFAKKMLTDTQEKIRNHPLLRNPSVYKAVPYEELIKRPASKPQDIYLSLLRKVVLEKPQVGILEADIAVKDLLQQFKLNSKQKTYVLSFSPRYRGLSQKIKESEVSRWLSMLALQSKQEKQK